jgi:hypothetical protein
MESEIMIENYEAERSEVVDIPTPVPSCSCLLTKDGVMLSSTASQMEHTNEKRMMSVKKRISNVIKRQNQLLIDLKGRVFKILEKGLQSIPIHVGATAAEKTFAVSCDSPWPQRCRSRCHY